jgi:hypothetical protein
MRRRGLVLLILLITALPFYAQTALQRGDVLVQATEDNALLLSPFTPIIEMIVLDASGARKSYVQEKASVGFPAARGLVAPTPDRLFGTNRTSVIASFDARSVVSQLLVGSGLTDLSDLVAMRSGDLLTAEGTTRDNYIAPRLARFTRDGVLLSTHALPPVAEGMFKAPIYRGPFFMDLLADQCTVAWTIGLGESDLLRVRAFNICTNQPAADLVNVRIRHMGYPIVAAAVRALPNGDFLVGTNIGVLRFDRSGKQVAAYDRAADLYASYYLALTPDGSGFWTGAFRELRRIDFAKPDVVAVRVKTEESINALAVVGEWRAALQPLPVGKRRAVR